MKATRPQAGDLFYFRNVKRIGLILGPSLQRKAKYDILWIAKGRFGEALGLGKLTENGYAICRRLPITHKDS